MKHLLLAATLLLCSTAIAQERTAGSTVETQMTWSTLASQIKSVNTKADLINTRIDQAVSCGKQGLLYAPDAPGNVAGCLPAKTEPGTTNTINNIIACNKSGQVYNGTACVDSTSKPDFKIVTGTATKVGIGIASVTKYFAKCPAGYIMTSCTATSGEGNMTDSNTCTGIKTTYKYEAGGGGSTRTGPVPPGIDANTTYTQVYASCIKS